MTAFTTIPPSWYEPRLPLKFYYFSILAAFKSPTPRGNGKSWQNCWKLKSTLTPNSLPITFRLLLTAYSITFRLLLKASDYFLCCSIMASAMWQKLKILESLFDSWQPSDLYVSQGMRLDKAVGNYKHFLTTDGLQISMSIKAWASTKQMEITIKVWGSPKQMETTSTFWLLTAFRSLCQSRYQPQQSSWKYQSLFDFWQPSDLYVDQGMSFDNTVGNYNHFSTSNSVKSQC